eukprot:TRINITY_DN17925_c0_g1_i1.p1 TRINITY_DN17925_c0_g1~~TRINITY_DN17925_c0_g1_i1.p1  ORF type:complete len:195 (-),score=57.20 TRINITY_DN17925_c0_g1_i1:9-593(-)
MSSKAVRAKEQGGLTLIEMILFIVIIGVALAAIVGVLVMTTKGSADPLRRKQALMIAEGLLEEVELARFTYCQPGADNADTAAGAADCAGGLAENWGAEDGARPYDNINDYAAAAGQPTAAFDVGGQLADANGNPMGLSGYTARVTITPQALGGIGGAGAAADTEVLRIRVEVSYGSDTVVLDGFRTRYAPNFL